MRTIFLFTGLPGSGKSSVSKLFAKKENLPRISKDDEQVALFEKFGFNSNAEKKALVKRADTIILDKLSWFLNKYDSVVLDQWVRERKYIDSLIDELSANIILIYVCASPDVITARYNARSRPLCFDAKNVYPVIDGLTEFWPKTTMKKNIKTKKEYEIFLETITNINIIKIDSDKLSIKEETEILIDLLNGKGNKDGRLHKSIFRCD